MDRERYHIFSIDIYNGVCIIVIDEEERNYYFRSSFRSGFQRNNELSQKEGNLYINDELLYLVDEEDALLTWLNTRKYKEKKKIKDSNRIIELAGMGEVENYNDGRYIILSTHGGTIFLIDTSNKKVFRAAFNGILPPPEFIEIQEYTGYLSVNLRIVLSNTEFIDMNYDGMYKKDYMKIVRKYWDIESVKKEKNTSLSTLEKISQILDFMDGSTAVLM